MFVLILCLFGYVCGQLNQHNLQFTISPQFQPMIGEERFGFEIHNKVIGVPNFGSMYKFDGTRWNEQKPIGKESVYSRPLDFKGGDFLNKINDNAKHTIYVTESGIGIIGTEKTPSGLKQTLNFDPTGWKLEKDKPIYDSSKLQTTSTDKYNIFTSNCQHYTDKVFGK